MRLPLFPLSVVLYPSELIPLHIFESRYRALTSLCLEKGVPFGVLCQDDGNLARIGCAAKITSVLQRYADGRLDILAEGVQRFRLIRVYDNQDYLTADVRYLVEKGGPPKGAAVERLIAQHMRLLEIAERKIRPSDYRQTDNVSFLVARSAGLTLQQKQTVLEILHEEARIEYLIHHLEALIPRAEEVQELRKLRRKIKSNGHLEDWNH